ncbi:flagellar basal body-associated FliL family protein [Selenihalanaerobacter shriftii]|uniref:Flagellar protein FliL n=1 Tax=Selenihalanaerobacter shriftii TaxID=142842 RepID=A0A1T4MC91_9FIRM|nr:flagellar basal body-associated FliL family protein [Selenihalanaerobacter shriftii]SJZ64344.1 flagellar FliL protein [Selenihalanaerobacter shriftii]
MSDEGQNFKLMLVAMVVLSLIIAAGTSYFMLQQVGGSKNQTAKEKKSITKLGPTYKVGDFVVNLANGQRYIRLNLVLEVSNEDIIEELKKRNPQVRDAVISILRNKQQNDIKTKAGTRDLREEIRRELDKLVSEGNISNVFFTEFVVQ